MRIHQRRRAGGAGHKTFASTQSKYKAICEKFTEELLRAAKFQKAFLDVQNLNTKEQFDPIRHVSHVLKEGTFEERRELLGMVGTQLIIKHKVLSLPSHE